MSGVSRRRFGQGAAAFAALPAAAMAHNGSVHHQAEIMSFAFDPEVLTVRAGDTVTWTNRDFAPHTATDQEGLWDTGEIEKDGTATITFSETGEFSFFCAYHPHMTGRVSVT